MHCFGAHQTPFSLHSTVRWEARVNAKQPSEEVGEYNEKKKQK